MRSEPPPTYDSIDTPNIKKEAIYIVLNFMFGYFIDCIYQYQYSIYSIILVALIFAQNMTIAYYSQKTIQNNPLMKQFAIMLHILFIAIHILIGIFACLKCLKLILP